MTSLAIDTLRYAKRLEEGGVNRLHADAMAMALEEQLTGHFLSKVDADARFDGIDVRFDGIDARLDAMDIRFDGIDARLDGIDARLDAMDVRFNGIDARLDKLETRLDIMQATTDAKFAAIDAKFESIERQLKIMLGVMFFGFTLLVALGLYQPYRASVAGAVVPTLEQRASSGGAASATDPNPVQAAPAAN